MNHAVLLDTIEVMKQIIQAVQFGVFFFREELLCEHV